ncbi:hypothetical protein [Caulobacter sp. RHG1]|uniref:hypothetical protein n=1 Tax=Caulobacter sp. (strain RHG1) TaxID=2545762 RepID=UPI0015521F22|nr:hypothetical protein [Caulobacter sp. RHG1]NQE65558.1 hypothetical protein [Caulobacter sp. RHG1]
MPVASKSVGLGPEDRRWSALPFGQAGRRQPVGSDQHQLYETKTSEAYTLIWSRPKPPKSVRA